MIAETLLARPRRAFVLGLVIAALSYPFNIMALLYGWSIVARLASPYFADNHHAPDYLAGLALHFLGYAVLAGLAFSAVRRRSARVRSAAVLLAATLYSIAVVVYLVAIGPIGSL